MRPSPPWRADCCYTALLALHGDSGSLGVELVTVGKATASGKTPRYEKKGPGSEGDLQRPRVTSMPGAGQVREVPWVPWNKMGRRAWATWSNENHLPP